jgi:type II secretory pathway pseudopilin PulG
MIKIFKNNKAFTLIETLIYLAIIALVVTTFVSFGLAISQRGTKSFVVAEVNSNGLQVMEIISNKIKISDAVISPTKSNSGTALELDMPSTTDNTTLQVSDGYLQIAEGLNPPVNLTSNLVTVTNFNVVNNARGNSADNLTVSFTVSYKTQQSIEFVATQNFTTTVSRRK